jgi:hypothetical protein
MARRTARPPRERHHGARLRRRQRSAAIPGNRGRHPCRRAARHLQLRLRPHLHPRRRQRPPYLRPDDQRGKNKISHRSRAVEAMRNGLGLR